MKQKNKPDIAADPIYPHLAKASLEGIHNYLLTTLEERLDNPGKKEILVIGPGSDVLPYSNNWERTKQLLNGGNLSLMDYNKEIVEQIPANLKEQGIKEKVITGKKSFERKKPTVFTYEGNVLNDLDQWDHKEKFDAIEMTLSVHHATQNYTATDRIFKGAYAALKPGGTLFIGEGNVDMKYSQRKIHSLLDDLVTIVGEEFNWDDNRDENRTWYNKNRNTSDGHIEIDKKANVTITHPTAGPKIYAALQEKGYAVTNYGGQQNVMPLIDPNNEADYEGLIKPVTEYYEQIRARLEENLPEEHKAAGFAALTNEENNARRGVVEHYSRPEYLVHAMVENGFVIKDTQYMTDGPFVGIVAEKPLK